MSTFSRNRYRKIVAEHMEPKLGIFWRDFLLAYAAFVTGVALIFVGPLWLNIAGFLLGVVMAYRCASYVHEVVHLPKTSFKSFIVGWNALIGVPFLMPSMLYESHLDHHIPRKYGTEQDPEYLPLKGSRFLHLVQFILHHALLTPLVLYVRMLVGLPARLLAPKLAKKLDLRFSSLVINWQYERVTGQNKKLLMALEGYVLVVNIIGALLINSGILSPVMILKVVSVILVALVLNGIRTLAAHQYHNMDLKAVDTETQLLDSTNYGGPAWIGLIMAPVGLRYHALHHLFPTMPYHELHAAHAKLMAALPADDVYRETVFTSFTAQLGKLMEAPKAPTVSDTAQTA